MNTNLILHSMFAFLKLSLYLKIQINNLKFKNI